MMIFYLFIHLFLLFGVSLNKVKSKFEGRRVSMRRENAFHLSLRAQFSLYIRTIYRIVIIFQFFFFQCSLPRLSRPFHFSHRETIPGIHCPLALIVVPSVNYISYELAYNVTYYCDAK